MATYKISQMIIDLNPEFYALLHHVTQDRKLPAKRLEYLYEQKFLSLLLLSKFS